jgi:uncharacterized membrane protein YbhN (UPF0104 family)
MRRRSVIRLTKGIVAVALLAALYWAADWRAVLRAAADLRAEWLAAAMLLFVPQTLASALRWRAVVRGLCALSVRQAVRQTLAASALNLVVPSKLGDLSKAGMLDIPRAAQTRAALLAVWEKAADVLALAFFWAAGTWGVVPAAGGLILCGAVGCSARALWIRQARMPAAFDVGRWTLDIRCSGSTDDRTPAPDHGGIPWVSLTVWSLALWSLHLLQIGCFLQAAGVDVGVRETIARVPPAIFAGLVPLTLWGVGTRDAALIHLFADLAPASTMAVVGMLTALRYVVPGAAGIALVPGAFARAEGTGSGVNFVAASAIRCH